MLNKKLEQREDGKYKLIESILIKPSQIKKVKLTESKKVLHENKEYKAIAVYSFPISKPGTLNLNERIYSESLWRKVIQEKQAENSYGLMGHPEGDGSPADAWCVWHNIRLEKINGELFTMADAWLFGPHGQQVNEGIEAGSEVGLSTAGYGDFEEDGITIRTKDYELERVADHVLTPSFGVFGTLEDFKESKTNKTDDSVLKNYFALMKIINSKKKESLTETETNEVEFLESWKQYKEEKRKRDPIDESVLTEITLEQLMEKIEERAIEELFQVKPNDSLALRTIKKKHRKVQLKEPVDNSIDDLNDITSEDINLFETLFKNRIKKLSEKNEYKISEFDEKHHKRMQKLLEKNNVEHIEEKPKKRKPKTMVENILRDHDSWL